MITDAPTSEETARLVMDAAAGSREAFAQLVRLNHEQVRTFLCRYLPRTDVADDVAQDVFLVAYRRMAEYRGHGSFTSWLLGIARNLALVYLRGEARRKRRDLEAAIARWQADHLHDADHRVADHERTLAALRACIRKLPPPSRRLIDRFYFVGETAESIAVTLGRQPGAVRMTLLRLRQVLATCVDGQLRDEEVGT